MELARRDLALLHRGDELAAVIARREDPILVRLLRDGAVGVHEIQPVAVRDVGQQPGVLPHVERVPADVRHDEVVPGEPPDGPGDHAEPLHAAALFAAVEEELQPEADAHERLAGRDVIAQRVHEPARLQDVHRAAVRADAREYQPVRARDLFRLGDVDHGEPELRYRVSHGPDVARAVVEEVHLLRFRRDDDGGGGGAARLAAAARRQRADVAEAAGGEREREGTTDESDDERDRSLSTKGRQPPERVFSRSGDAAARRRRAGWRRRGGKTPGAPRRRERHRHLVRVRSAVPSRGWRVRRRRATRTECGGSNRKPSTACDLRLDGGRGRARCTVAVVVVDNARGSSPPRDAARDAMTLSS